MNIVNIKKYNEMQTAKWNKNYDAVMKAVNEGTRHITELPQLAFYIFDKEDGFVAYNDNSAYWHKTKREAILKHN